MHSAQRGWSLGKALGKRLAPRGRELVPPESLLHQSRYSHRRPVGAPARTLYRYTFQYFWSWLCIKCTMYSCGPECDVAPPAFYRILFPASSSNSLDVDVDCFPASLSNWYHIAANMEDIPVVNDLFHFLMGPFLTSRLGPRFLPGTWRYKHNSVGLSVVSTAFSIKVWLLSHSYLALSSERPPLLHPRSRGDGLKTGDGQYFLVLQFGRLSKDTHLRRRYQATKDDDYWWATIHLFGYSPRWLTLSGVLLTRSNLKHSKLGKSQPPHTVHALPTAFDLTQTEFSHMVFLVLDHYQDNPLFRAPIGDLPKVNKAILRHACLGTLLTSEYSIF